MKTMEKKKPRRRVRPRPMDLRYETQRQWIARLLLLGWTAERIARRLAWIIHERTVSVAPTAGNGL